ncbi:tape measure domain-containing protein [Bifidobacterium saguini DSM 23967]|uniref:Tape measure domain-containing protein n=2 Tax=Bifidobacterium saguini TaxID=762210 RepID=A0A087DA82_9BIFI|nr:tape measure protein [Bifidobacterium saguini]KFI92432.1 tape measure domain-containing protein [Bifidobacterium saguini DSM 23967]QTB90841.1 tape measure protein [Bifidobacterium saguini]QTB90890.1 tape measure protein [Bifidobacterium saguini]
MAQDIGTVYVQVVPSGKDFGKTLEGDITGSVDNAARKSGTNLTGTLGKAFGTIGKLGLGAIGTITGGIAGLAAKGGFERALNIENAQAKLKGLGHDSASVAKIMNNALASVKGTAFGLGDAATVAASLSAAGVESGEQLTKVLKTVADTAQISGRELTDIGTIFGSVAARGKLQGDDMLQLMSSGVPVLQMLAKHLNTTAEDVSDLVTKGKIDFQTFADAMQEGLGGAALAAGDTFSGALANVKAALSRLGEGPGKIALESLRKMFNAAIPAVDALSSQLTPFVEQLNGKLSPYVDRAVQLIERFSEGLQDGSISIQDITGSIGSLVGAFALFAGVGGNVDTITGIFDTLGKLGDGGIGKLASKVKQMPGQLQSGLTGLQQFKAYFNKDLRDALAIDGDPFAETVNRILQGGDKITGPLRSLGSKIGNSDLVQSVAGMADKVGVGFGKITSAFDSNIRVLGVKVGDGFGNVFSKVSDSKLVSGLGSLAGKTKTALTPVISGIGGMLDGVGDVFGGIGDIVGPKVQAGLGKIGSLFGSFFSPGNFMKYMGIAGIIAALVAGLGMLDQSMQGQLFAMIGNISAQIPGWLQTLNMQITANLPAMLAQGAAILTALMNAISTNAPQLMNTAMLIITTLVNGLAAQLPTLLPAALNMVMALVNGLASNAGQLLNSGMQLLLGLVQGLVNALPQLINQAPTIIGNLASSIAANLPQILQTGMQILVTLANGLASAIPQLLGKIPAIVKAIWNAFSSVNWGDVGMNIITGIASGLASAAGKLVDAAVKAATDALNWVKDKLGIQSPSRVFRDEVGVMIGRGMAEGITRSENTVNRSLGALASGLTLDGYTFGMPAMNLPANAYQMVNRAEDQNRQASSDELLAELKALHEDLPIILEHMGISIDGREFGRLTRRYAYATV